MREAERSEVGEREREDRERVGDLERAVESERDGLRREGEADLDRLRAGLGDVEWRGERLGPRDGGELDRGRDCCPDGEAAGLLSRRPPPFVSLLEDDIGPVGWYAGSVTSSSELELRLGELLCLPRRMDILREFLGVETLSTPVRTVRGSGVG